MGGASWLGLLWDVWRAWRTWRGPGKAGQGIAGDEERAGEEDRLGGWVHGDLDAVEVGGAECAEEGELGGRRPVFDRAEAGFESVLVVIRVNQEHGLPESDGFGGQRFEEPPESRMSADGIGLKEEGHTGRLGGAGHRESLAQPGDIGFVALAPLVEGSGNGGLMIVAAADDVEGHEDDPSVGPSGILDEPGVAWGPPLRDQRNRARAAAGFGGKEHFADPGQAFERLVFLGAVDVGPFVVSRSEHEGCGDRIELAQAASEEFIRAEFLTPEDVAEMDREDRGVAIDLVEDPAVVRVGVGKARVGHAPDGDEAEGANARRRFGDGFGWDRGQDPEGGEPGDEWQHPMERMPAGTNRIPGFAPHDGVGLTRTRPFQTSRQISP